MLIALVGADAPPAMPDLGSNWTAVILGVIGLIGTLLTVRQAKKAARRTPPPPPRASAEDVHAIDQRVTELEDTVKSLVQRLANRTDQYNGIRTHWYALRDAFIQFVGQVNGSWGTTDRPPELSDDQRAMLYQPLPVEDDPDVYDTKRREEVRRIQAESAGEYPSRRSVRDR